jgi:hypothetical protein
MMYSCVLYDSRNKRQVFPQTALTGWGVVGNQLFKIILMNFRQQWVNPYSLSMDSANPQRNQITPATRRHLLRRQGGRAIAQAVSRWLPTTAARGSSPGLVM